MDKLKKQWTSVFQSNFITSERGQQTKNTGTDVTLCKFISCYSILRCENTWLVWQKFKDIALQAENVENDNLGFWCWKIGDFGNQLVLFKYDRGTLILDVEIWPTYITYLGYMRFLNFSHQFLHSVTVKKSKIFSGCTSRFCF